MPNSRPCALRASKAVFSIAYSPPPRAPSTTYTRARDEDDGDEEATGIGWRVARPLTQALRQLSD